MQKATKASTIEKSALWYRRNMGWQVDAGDRFAVLTLSCGLVAFDVPEDRADLVRALLRHEHPAGTPAFLPEDEPGRVVFLANANDTVYAQADMPVDVRYRFATQTCAVPPRPGWTSKWFSQPDPRRRWLASAPAVFSAIGKASPKGIVLPPRARPQPIRLAS